MTVENAQYINQLDPNEPTRDKIVDEGDDHLRLIKHTLKETFPNIDKAVTVSASAINAVSTNITIDTNTIDFKGNTLTGIVSSGSDGLPNLGTNDSTYIKPGESTRGSLYFNAITNNQATLIVNLDEIATNKIRIIGKNVYLENSPVSGGVDSFEINYPVGTIYKNATSAVNPATLLGFGTWSLIGPGRVLVGQGGTLQLGNTGGAKTHTLTTNQIPPHNHAKHSNSNGYPPGNKYQGTATAVSARHSSSSSSGGGISSTGGGVAHNNLQPYIVESIWMRTA